MTATNMSVSWVSHFSLGQLPSVPIDSCPAICLHSSHGDSLCLPPELDHLFLFLKDFLKIYSWETHRERQRHRQREKQASCREPDAGLDPRTLGSWPEPPKCPQSLCFTSRFIHGVVHSLGFDKGLTCVHHSRILQNSFTVPNTLCVCFLLLSSAFPSPLPTFSPWSLLLAGAS